MIQKVSCCDGRRNQAFGARKPKLAAVNVAETLIKNFAGVDASSSNKFLAAEELRRKLIPALEKNPNITGKDLIAGLKSAIASAIL